MAGKHDRPFESLPLSDKFLAKLIAGPFSIGFESFVALVMEGSMGQSDFGKYNESSEDTVILVGCHVNKQVGLCNGTISTLRQ